MKNKKVYLSIFALLIFLFMGVCVSFSGKTYTKTGYAMNTVINIQIETYSSKKADKVLNEVFREIDRIEKLLSCHISGSEVSALNENACKSPMKVSRETYGLIKRCIKYSKDTDGAFDITVKPLCDLWNVTADNPKVPGKAEIEEILPAVGCENIVLHDENKISFKNSRTKIDLGGVAKGYCADRVKDVLKNMGIKNALVDLGGNIYAMGKKGGVKSWTVGIQTPFEPRGNYSRILKGCNTAVVTSGAYERYFEKNGTIYHHIISPKTGYPAKSDISSVTVTGQKCETADMLSTALYVAGADEIGQILEKYKGFSVTVMDEKDRFYVYE